MLLEQRVGQATNKAGQLLSRIAKLEQELADAKHDAMGWAAIAGRYVRKAAQLERKVAKCQSTST
jgi:hypothetical protein